MSRSFFAVVELNQASGIPEVVEIHLDKNGARGHAADLAEETERNGRRERYRVADLILHDDEH